MNIGNECSVVCSQVIQQLRIVNECSVLCLQVIQQVSMYKLLESPRPCPQELYKIMLGCWKKQPSERLTMREIHVKLENMCVKQPLYIEIVENDQE